MFFTNYFFYIDIVSTLTHPARSSSRVVSSSQGFQTGFHPVFFQKGLYIQFLRLMDGWIDVWVDGWMVMVRLYMDGWMDGWIV